MQQKVDLIATEPLQDLNPSGEDPGVSPPGGEATQEHRQLLLVPEQSQDLRVKRNMASLQLCVSQVCQTETKKWTLGHSSRTKNSSKSCKSFCVYTNKLCFNLIQANL